MIRCVPLALVLALFSIQEELLAQNNPGSSVSIRKAKGEIKLDGVLDEADWIVADIATDFYLNYPVDTARAPFQTEARLTYDDHNLYVSFVCFDNTTPDIVQSLRRDFDFDNNDNVTMLIGPYNDRINGFFFSITPRGVQLEGTIAQGGSSDDSYSSTWDNKWYSKVTKYEDRWIAELQIPFKSFRFKSNLKEWNINFLRWDRKRNLVSTWVATPIQYSAGSFAYSGQLVWQDPSPVGRTNISLIPFLAGSSSVDREEEPTERKKDFQGGFDAKIGITPSLNLDLTVNPDFSQVEVDRQVINLTRFEFKFPERRQFFLENSDLFDNAGFPEARSFFSRRLGLVRDTADNLQKVPIQYGARLSGSITRSWRVSAMNMQTDEKLSLGLPKQNYTVATVQHNFWRQSNASITFVNKESLGITLGDTTKYFHENLLQRRNNLPVLNNFNRVLTMDMDLLSVDNKWYSSSFFSHSFDPVNKSNNNAGGVYNRYSQRKVDVSLGANFVQKDFTAEAGFVPSHDVYPGQLNTFASVSPKFYPKGKKVVLMIPGINTAFTTIPDGTLTDRNIELSYNLQLLNTSSLRFRFTSIFQKLTDDFNPIDEDKYSVFKEGESFNWQSASIDYQSDQRKIFNYSLSSTVGGFYSGSNLNVNGQLNYRYQPFGSLAIRFDFNDIKLPGNYGKEKLFLVGPRLDLTFTDKLFLTTFVQYNNVDDNVNLNTRFQWRYKPASDFFVVYTENYLPQPFGSKNRALVFKFIYWLNI